MKSCALLSLLLALGCVHAAPVEEGGLVGGLVAGSCEDASALAAAEQALTKINHDRHEGYILSLHRLSNVHTERQGEIGEVFYLTLDVVETNCSTLSKKDWKTCEARPTGSTPVYGQCQAAIYISRVHRVVRLYKYSCTLRPVPHERISQVCPDCGTLTDLDSPKIKETVTRTLEEFNKKSNLKNIFSLLKITRASIGAAISTYYTVEYSIQETTCTKATEEVTAEKCPPLKCEFAHKGFCTASLFETPTGKEQTSVECEIYEPEAAEREKKLHLLGGETDHSHNDTHTHTHSQDHDQVHAADQTHTHDHVHDHTKSHAKHEETHKHDDNSDHHHTHDHDVDSVHRHAHDHSHDHGHGHDHVHAHHAKAHDHSGDAADQHHVYQHADGTHTHEHDHELALDHDHKHAHLHEHEHHHHHHEHEHETTAHDDPHGIVRILPALGQPVTLPSFPDVPAGGPEVGVVLPLKPDPEIPGEREPTIEAFPITVSPQCPRPGTEATLVEKLFKEDPLFQPAA